MRFTHACLLFALLLAIAFIAGCPKPQTTGDETYTPPPTPGQEGMAATSDTGEADEATEPSGGLKGELIVGCPCGLAMAYKEAREMFLKANPDVTFVDHVKNVQPMVRELRDKKVAMDVFLALGDREMDRLIDEGIIVGEGTPFLRQRMHLTVQLGNPLGIESYEDLLKDDVKTVAVCDPSLSIGYYGQKALEAAGVWDKLNEAGKIVRPDQPVKAKNLVIDKKADAAFTYAACAAETWSESNDENIKDLSLADKADPLFLVDEELSGPMYAVAGVPAGAPNPELAEAFIKFMLTAPVQDKMAEMGYGKVEQPKDETACATDSEGEMPFQVS